MKTVQKACLTGIVLAGLLSVNIATAYDGDVDYSAPYVTLDPETGKLITVDPKQQPAAAQSAPQHEGTASDAATAAAATPAINAGANTDETTSAEAGTSPVLIAVAAIVLVAVVVATTRRKTTPSTEDHTS